MITSEKVINEIGGSKQCAACSKLNPYIVDHEGWHRKRCGLRSSENFQRIHIIGGPGSGKTTLARRIGAYIGAQTHELDHIAFSGRDFAERPFVERVSDIAAIANSAAWITEGFFVQWTEKLLARANMIVWLDHVTWERGIWRIARRSVRSAVHEAQRRQGLQRFTRFQDYARHVRQFIQVVFSSRAYYTGYPSPYNGRIESRSSTAKFLQTYSDKVVHCTNDRAVEAFVDYICYCHENGR